MSLICCFPSCIPYTFFNCLDPPTLNFIHEIRKAVGKEHELPPVDTSMSFRQKHQLTGGGTIAAHADAMTPLEQKVRWFTSNWDTCPEVKWLRDIHFLYRMSLEPYEVFRALNPSMPELWYEQNATPSFGLLQVDPRGKQAQLSIILGDSGIKYSKEVVPSPANVTRFVQPSGTSGTTNEEDVLHTEELPNFENALSPEESEHFLSCFIILIKIIILFSKCKLIMDNYNYFIF